MFESGKFYRANDEALTKIWSYWTLAEWRCKGRGPTFVKIGRRVFYRGQDLNDWIERQVVRPVAS